MDDDLRLLNEAMVLKDRLKMLAELQASYWQALTDQGFEQGTAEQLVLDWSRHAYDMTLRSLPTSSSATMDRELDDLLAEEEASRIGADPDAVVPAELPARDAQPAAASDERTPSGRPFAAPRQLADPSQVPPGEPWLQLAPELHDELEPPGEQAA